MGQVVLSFGRHADSTRLYHSRFGCVSTPLDVGAWVSAGQKLQRLKISAIVEVDESALQYSPAGELGPHDTWMGVRSAVEAATRELGQSGEFEEFLDDQEMLEKRRHADALRRRQVQLESRPKVVLGDRELVCVPQSENEVVLLLAKLEALDAIPLPHFRIMEYTPARGIDAIGHFQVDDAGAMERFVPIEVEFQFENFWAHGHAVEQVRMIVCWCFRGDGASYGSRLRHHEDWLYQYVEERYTVWVVLLSKLPNLTQRGGTG